MLNQIIMHNRGADYLTKKSSLKSADLSAFFLNQAADTSNIDPEEQQLFEDYKNLEVMDEDDAIELVDRIN